MAAFKEEPREVAIDAELIGGPANGMRVRVSSGSQVVGIPLVDSSRDALSAEMTLHHKIRLVMYYRSSDPRTFTYVPSSYE